MKEIVEFLNENSAGIFATVVDNKPKVRPWGFIMEEEGKFYFTTANTKDVYKQLQNNPNVAFTSTAKDMKWLRLYGQVKFVDDLAIKEKIIAKNNFLKEKYQSADNPIFEAFYVENGQASIHEFGGTPIVEYKF